MADTYINCHIGTASSNRGQFSPSRRDGHKFPPLRSFQGLRGGKTERPPGNATANQIKEMRPTPTVDPNQFDRRCWRCQSTKQVAPSEGQIEGQLLADSACNRVMYDTDSVMIAKRCDENDCWEFGNFPEVNHCKDVVTQC